MMASSGSRRGMTLVEMLVALVVFGILITGALSLLEGQVRAFTLGTDRMTVLQNVRFAANVLEKDLRTVGSGVPGNQPFIMHAGRDVFAFNADYTSNVANDVWTVYRDTTADTLMVSALTPARRLRIPGTSTWYPDTAYVVSGTNSPAETIVFYFEADTTTGRDDDYVLYRQVNDTWPEVVSRNLVRMADEPFFTYLRLASPTGAAPRLDTIPASDLPLVHGVPVHLSAQDTGAVAVVDSIRAVRIRFTATNGVTGPQERRSPMSRLIRLPNAGLAVLQTCGGPPILGSSLGAEAIEIAATNQSAVELTWDPATDETAGEQDVIRYVLWRRQGLAPDWGDPIISLPAGQPSYTYLDTKVVSGESYTYAVAVQDCTPSLSDLAISGEVTVP